MSEQSSTAHGRLLMSAPEHRSLRQGVYEALRKAIFSGALEPGERVVEAELARQLKTSRAPVREAIRQLEQEGLLEHNPHRGCVVRVLPREDVRDLYGLRALIEGVAIRRATLRVSPECLARLSRLIEDMRGASSAADLVDHDVEFHTTIVREAGSPQILRVWRSLNPQTWTFLSVTKLPGRSAQEIAARHQPVLDALASRNSDRAEAAVRFHILAFADEVVARLPSDSPLSPRVPRESGTLVGSPGTT
jgi:DNA-binding GntR family transcriptional regulator